MAKQRSKTKQSKKSPSKKSPSENPKESPAQDLEQTPQQPEGSPEQQASAVQESDVPEDPIVAETEHAETEQAGTELAETEVAQTELAEEQDMGGQEEEEEHSLHSEAKSDQEVEEAADDLEEAEEDAEEAVEEAVEEAAEEEAAEEVAEEEDIGQDKPEEAEEMSAQPGEDDAAAAEPEVEDAQEEVDEADEAQADEPMAEQESGQPEEPNEQQQPEEQAEEEGENAEMQEALTQDPGEAVDPEIEATEEIGAADDVETEAPDPSAPTENRNAQEEQVEDVGDEEEEGQPEQDATEQPAEEPSGEPVEEPDQEAEAQEEAPSKEDDEQAPEEASSPAQDQPDEEMEEEVRSNEEMEEAEEGPDQEAEQEAGEEQASASKASGTPVETPGETPAETPVATPAGEEASDPEQKTPVEVQEQQPDVEMVDEESLKKEPVVDEEMQADDESTRSHQAAPSPPKQAADQANVDKAKKEVEVKHEKKTLQELFFAESIPEGPLQEVDLSKEKYQLKAIVMAFLLHPDSADQDISDEFEVKYDLGKDNSTEEQLLTDVFPTSFRLHEVFPILLLQDGTHFCSFALTDNLHKRLREEQLKKYGADFCELSQYHIRVKKVRVQLRRVDSNVIFSSYLAIELRLIVTDAEILKKGFDEGVEQKKDWSIKSLYRDEDIRSLILLKVHQRQMQFIDAEPEFDDYPEPKKFKEPKDLSRRLNKTYSCVVQPDQGTLISKTETDKGLTRQKPEVAVDLFFELMHENYDDLGINVFDSEDIIVLEKGRTVFGEMVQARKEMNERRRRTDFALDPTKVFIKNQSFNTEEERKRTQERQQQRQMKNEIKECAEQVKMSYFQLASFRKHFPQDIPEQQQKTILKLSKRANNPVPPRIHFHHTKRFIEWVRQNVINDPLATNNQIERNKDEPAENLTKDFSSYYQVKGEDTPGHDFGITVIQRCGTIAHGYSHTSQSHQGPTLSSAGGPSQDQRFSGPSSNPPTSLNQKRTQQPDPSSSSAKTGPGKSLQSAAGKPPSQQPKKFEINPKPREEKKSSPSQAEATTAAAATPAAGTAGAGPTGAPSVSSKKMGMKKGGFMIKRKVQAD